MQATQSIRPSAQRVDARVLHHRVLEGETALAAEEAEWNGLVERHHGSNPFLQVDWHLLWLRHFLAPDLVPRYVKLMRGDRTVAYVPLLLQPARFHGVPARRLSLAGNLYSPVRAVISDRSAIAEVMDHLVAQVLPSLDWDYLEFEGLADEHPGLAELEQALTRAGCRPRVHPDVGNWIYRGGASDAASYFAELKKNIRNDTRRFPKKLAALGTLSFRLVREDLRERDAEAYRAVYARSWKEPELDPSFHLDLMRVAARSGQLRLGLLHLDDRCISAQLWLYSAGWGYVVKTAHDEDLRAYSPGTILTWRMIEALMDGDGMKAFDYLKGDDAYKKYWTNERRERKRLIAFRPSARGRILHCLDERVLPLVRRSGVLNRLKAALARALS